MVEAGPQFGPPKIPVEFPRVKDVLALYECSICRALVTEAGAQPHADWHNGERMRNFTGF